MRYRSVFLVAAVLPCIQLGSALAAPMPSSAREVTRCGTLNRPGQYKVSVPRLAASSKQHVCLTIDSPELTLDLNDASIEGRIIGRANPSGVTISNGKVKCDWADNDADVGCISFISDAPVTTPLALENLDVRNEAGQTGKMGGRSIHIDWKSQFPSRQPSIILKRIRSVVENQPNVVRSSSINVNGLNQFVEISDSELRCGAKAQACQGVVCYDPARCLVHDTVFEMDENSTAETARAIVFDGCLSGEAWNNTVRTHNNRAVRIRDSVNIAIHDNLITDITAGVGAIHLGDPDFGTDHLKSTVFRNRFQVSSGAIIFARNVAEVEVHDNTVECAGKCEGKLAVVRTPVPQECSSKRSSRPGAACREFKSVITFRDNEGVTALSSPQVEVSPGAVVSICRSGLGGPAPNGTGVIHSCASGDAEK